MTAVDGAGHILDASAVVIIDGQKYALDLESVTAVTDGAGEMDLELAGRVIDAAETNTPLETWMGGEAPGGAGGDGGDR